MKRFIRTAAVSCAMLLSAYALAEEPAASLISCEYSVFGGMENESVTYTAAQGDTRWEATLTVADHDITREYLLPWGTLDDLADYMFAPGEGFLFYSGDGAITLNFPEIQ